MAAELGPNFSLSKALKEGLLPLLFNKTNVPETLQAYINLYIQQEVQTDGLVRNLENFSRFLEAISFSHASLLNISNVARECEVKRKTIENYIGILEDLLLAYTIPIFSRRTQRDLVSHPKFYLFDTAIYRTLRPSGILDTGEEIEGAALEGLVAQHLKAWNSYSQEKHTLSFWRTRSGVEVDFIIYGPRGLWAIEVKNSKRISSHNIKGLRAFSEDYPMATTILLYRGTEYRRINNVYCIPCEDFLKSLQPNQPIKIEKQH